MFGNRSLTSGRGERSLSNLFSGLSPWNTPSSPWTNLREDLFDIFDQVAAQMPAVSVNRSFIPRIELKDKGDTYQINAEVPGMNEKDMKVTIRDNCLILEGEKKEEFKEEKRGTYRSEFSYGSFYRSIPLSDEIDPDKVTANYRNGVLKVLVDKKPEASRRSRKINIAVEGTETKH